MNSPDSIIYPSMNTKASGYVKKSVYVGQSLLWLISEKLIFLTNFLEYYKNITTGFGGLGVVCWPLLPKFAGSNPAEAVGFLRRKSPQHAFLRRGSKAVSPMS